MPSDLRITRSLSSPYSVVRSHSAPSFSYVLPLATSAADGRVDLAVGVQARLQVVDVEAHAELLQVDVLLVAQVRDREAPHGLQIVDLAARLDRLAVERVHGLLRAGSRRRCPGCSRRCSRLRPARLAGLDAARARLHRQREVLDLHAGVVVVELAADLVALRLQQRGERVAERRLPAVADVQRAGRIGRDELDAPCSGRAALAVTVGRRRARRCATAPGWYACAERWKLMKPGPAISALSISSLRGQRAERSPAPAAADCGARASPAAAQRSWRNRRARRRACARCRRRVGRCRRAGCRPAKSASAAWTSCSIRYFTSRSEWALVTGDYPRSSASTSMDQRTRRASGSVSSVGNHVLMNFCNGECVAACSSSCAR